MAKSAIRATATRRSSSARMFSGASPPLTDRIPIPPASTFNVGLSSADEATMLRLLGIPGRKTENCSPATGDFRIRIKTGSVGPFRVTGLDLAVDLLKAAFDEAAQQIPDVVAAAKTAGMLCVRHKRNNPRSFSNHSWGTAIDLFFGSDVVPQGVRKTDRGCLLLAPFLNHHGWFWGAGFSGGSVDSMHFELSKETIQQRINS
jgi:D-alanyl-D-alanine carboxypeptidase-like protein